MGALHPVLSLHSTERSPLTPLSPAFALAPPSTAELYKRNNLAYFETSWQGSFYTYLVPEAQLPILTGARGGRSVLA